MDMDGRSASTWKLAAVIGLGAAAASLLQAGGPPAWRDPGPLGVLAGLSLLAVRWLYRLLLCPLELLRAPDDVGYIAGDGRSRARAANEARRRRRTGDLPPVYPNGWFRALDSHMLRRGEVKHASLLGTTALRRFQNQGITKGTGCHIIRALKPDT